MTSFQIGIGVLNIRRVDSVGVFVSCACTLVIIPKVAIVRIQQPFLGNHFREKHSLFMKLCTNFDVTDSCF